MSMPGAPGEAQSPANLDLEGQAALAFATANVHDTGALVSFRTQVVAGINYQFKFENVDNVTVWSQPWNNNFLEVTLPNGNKVNNQN